MSYQYINTGFLPKEYNYQYTFNSQPVHQVSQYVQNPYQTSFYNQSVIYPYNPLFQPNLDKNYTFLGVVPSSSGDNVHLFRLNNGQTVAIMPKENTGTIVKTFLNAGSMNESDELRGISHTIEHMLFKGSSKLEDGDVFKKTAQMGANTNASTDFAQTDYYIEAPYLSQKDVNSIIEIQGDMISKPVFEYNALESEKAPICSEISMMDDRVLTQAYNDVIQNLFQINSSSHNLVAGSIQTVSGLEQNDLFNHHQTYYNPSDMYTVVVGDVDVSETIDLISKNFSIKSKTSQELANKYIEELKPIQASKRVDMKSSKTNSTFVVMAFSGPKAIDGKDFVIANMLNYYLTSCSTSPLKKGLEKLNGDFEFSYQKVGLKQTDPYAIVNVMQLNPNDEQKGIDLFYDTISTLQNTSVSDDDLIAMKNYLEKIIEMGECDSAEICDILGTSLMNNTLDVFSNYEAIVNSITKEDIKEFLNKYFDLSKVSMIVVHPSSVSDEEINRNYQNSKYGQHNASNISFRGSSPNISTSGVKEYKLANNTRLALNNSNSNLCAFKWSVDTPPIKPNNPNIPAVLAYMFQKGSQYLNQNDLERYKELNGIAASVDVYGKSIEISANCMPQNSAKTLALMNELMYHPNLTQSDFDDAKKYLKDILSASQKDANSNLLDKLYPGYFPTESAMLKELDKLTLDDVKEFYSQLLKNASSSFVASAPFEKFPFLQETIFEYQNNNYIPFKEISNSPRPIYQENPVQTVIYDTDDLNQAQICKTYKFPMSGNVEDEAKFELVNTILGASPDARLFSDLRDKQNLAYSVFSSINSFENTGILTMQIQTTTDNTQAGIESFDNVQKSLDGFQKHTDLLCKEYVSDEELQSAKIKLKQKLIAQTQNPISNTNLLTMNMLQAYGIRRIDKYLEAIDKITKEDIKQAANFIFSRKPTISILASEKTIASQMDYLKTQGQLIKAE